MERSFIIEEISPQSTTSLLNILKWEFSITESEIRARLDAIIALRVNKGGEHWNWEQAIEILTEGVKSYPTQKR